MSQPNHPTTQGNVVVSTKNNRSWLGNLFPHRTNLPAGNVLESTRYNELQINTQQTVKESQPFGTKVPKNVLDRASGWSQLANFSHEFTFEKVQAAMRQAETGDTSMLFAFYRDFFLGTGTIAGALSKRKIATLSEPYKIIPIDKHNPDDVKAAQVVQEVLDNCENFDEAVIHILNAIVFPIAGLEKIYDDISVDNYNNGENKFNLRYKLKQLTPIDYNLVTYRLPYLPLGPINVIGQPVIPNAPLTPSLQGRPEDTIWDPDSWECNIRFWSVFENGLINKNYAYMMSPDRERHIIYRCNLLSGIARENWGGLGRSLLWWAIMSQVGVDVYLRCLQKFGMPLVVAKVDTTSVDLVNSVYNMFRDMDIMKSIVVNKDCSLEFQEMNYSSAGEAHLKFVTYCESQMMLIISGQTLDAKDSTGGMGTGKDSLQGEVRKDIINYDQKCINNCLRTSLFAQILKINGIAGSVPNIIFGGDAVGDIKDLSTTLYQLAQAGIEPTDEAIEYLTEKLGFPVQKKSIVGVDANGNPLPQTGVQSNNNNSSPVQDKTISKTTDPQLNKESENKVIKSNLLKGTLARVGGQDEVKV